MFPQLVGYGIQLAGIQRVLRCAYWSYTGFAGNAAKHRHRRLMHIPRPIVRWGLKAVEEVQGSLAFATWDEAELMEIPMVSDRGTADVQALGVHPARMADVLSY